MSAETERASVDVLAAQVREALATWVPSAFLNEGSMAALDALVERVTEAGRALAEKKQELAVAYGGGTSPDEREWFSALDRAKAERDSARAALADARNALREITKLTARDRTPRETFATTENAAAAGLEPARRLAREVLARLDGSQE